MIELAQMKADKDAENKKFIADIISKVTLGLVFTVGIVAAVLGAQTRIDSGSSAYDDDEDPSSSD